MRLCAPSEQVNIRPGMDKTAQNEHDRWNPFGRQYGYIYKERAGSIRPERGINMSYQVVDSKTGEVLESFETQDEADFAARSRQFSGQRVYSRKAPDMLWRDRERNRFRSGKYEPLVWSSESWFINRDSSLQDHYAHRATTRGLVAFTESTEKGEQDRQTVIKPGVYLTRYFADVLTLSEISHWSRLHTMESHKKAKIQFAISAEDIQDIYERGPDSCMSGAVSDYDSRIHPVSVYGDSDLSLAYIEDKAEYHDRDIASRALVWTEKKVYGRVYPTPERYRDAARDFARVEHDRLIQALELAGYRPGSFNGARINAIVHRGNEDSYVMPYLDGSYGVDLDGDSFVMSRNGSIEAQTTNGLICLADANTCERCDCRMSDEDSYSVYVSRHNMESWCDCCRENHSFYCSGNEEAYSDDIDSVSDNDGNQYCLSYARDHMFRCDITGCWYSNDESQEVNVNHGNTETWCQDAVSDHAFHCYGSDQYYSTRYFNQVEIDGETYEKVFAESDLILSTRLKEMEQAEEFDAIARFNIVLEGSI